MLLVIVVAWTVAHRRRVRRDAAADAQARADNLHLPMSLHPVIDPDVCIGSLACIQACPEGDILGIVDGAAKLIIGSNCIGHGRCAVECPVSAIRLVFGTSERGVDLPEVDEHFQSSRPGVHVVGELGGMGLIKNAITQGLQAADFVHRTLGRTRHEDGITDVAVVGAGPAGLAAAVALRAHGRSMRILEQGVMGGSIAHYPRHKVVMTETVKLPIWGRFGKKLISKEQLLATLKKIIVKAKLQVEEGVKVTGIDGEDGRFTVETTRGPVVARKVILAIGRRGSPRQLGVPGEDSTKVTYNLVDAQQYAGARTLVVGGGDSALEAAIQLAAQDGEVALSYRQKAFGKCRDANRRRIAELAAEGQVHLFMESQVVAVENKQVHLKTQAGALKLPNDYVIACLGGELPSDFLKSTGVSVKRLHGEALNGAAASTPSPIAQVAPVPRVTTPRAAATPNRSRLGFALFVVGALIVAGLIRVGGDYYLLPLAERRHAPLHNFLKPSGLWGHGVGIVATAFMLSNFLYAARKRIDALRGVGSIRSWLTWHMFVGFMSPVAIAFHAAFMSNNLIATSTYLSLLIVVGTGMIGRYVYGLVPGAGGKSPELAVLKAQLERQRRTVDDSGWPRALHSVWERAASPPAEGASLLVGLVTLPLARLRDRLVLWSARSAFTDGDAWRRVRETLAELERLRMQVGFYRGLKRFLSVWRVLHVTLAILLVMVMTAHIGISLYLGYRWIFR